MHDSFNATYWDQRYQEQQTGWDIGYASPPLTSYVDQLPSKNMRILVPGCGNGYEVEYLLQQGFTDVTVIDIAPSLTAALAEKLKQWAGKELKIITGDFFELDGQFDLVLEQTFFCALHPALRPEYVRKMHALLADKGKLAGVLFNRDFTGGPPFGGSKEEYEGLFRPYFNIIHMDACYNSIPPRAGTELFITLQKS
jgi:SAM-dependent methyltransferase